MIDEKIIRLIQKKDRTILDAEKELLEGLTPVELKIFDALKKQISKMNQTGGKIDFDSKNVDLVNELDKILVQTIQKSDYPGTVKKYLQNFDSVTDFNEMIHENVNGVTPEEFAKNVDPFKKQVVEDTLQGLTGAGVSTDFVEPLRQELFKNIVAGTNSIDVEKALREFISGTDDTEGKLKRYVRQVTRDALNQYDGQINSRIAEEFDLDAFQYVGSLIDDSRPQCIRWTGKEVILKKDLEKEISWAFNNGSGMIPGTNSNNFAVFRGGFNCRHAAIPFKLTKREKERLEKEEKKPVQKPEKAKISKEAIQDDPKAAVLKPLGAKELKYTYGKTDLIPESLKDREDLKNKIPDQLYILSDNGKANVTKKDDSHYSPGSKTVVLGLDSSRYINSENGKAKVTFHEFGHRAHFERELITYYKISDETAAAFKESQKIVKKRYNDDEDFRAFNYRAFVTKKKYIEKYKDVFTEKEISEMMTAYADTIQALTNSRIGWGHTKKYMKTGNLRFMEWFAHASENYFQGNIVFETEFKELFDQMNGYFSKDVIKKFLK